MVLLIRARAAIFLEEAAALSAALFRKRNSECYGLSSAGASLGMAFVKFACWVGCLRAVRSVALRGVMAR